MNVKVLIFTLATLAVHANSQLTDRIKKDIYTIYTHAAFETEEIIDEHVTPDKVGFFLFTKDSPENYTKIEYENPEKLANENVTVVFIIHGWLENREKQWYEDLKDAFLNRSEEYYVVQVDWSDDALKPYTLSSYDTKAVGFIIGDLIANLNKNYSVPLGNFLVVGHSLGGQIGGFVGKRVKEVAGGALPRIVALDPAGPLFTSRPKEERLNENDAKVVQVIHTDGGTFGFKEPCGTIDFFPNGGSSQPGCKTIDLTDYMSIVEFVPCDHQRSWRYFIEAVSKPHAFVAAKCNDWSTYEENSCGDKEEDVAMGNLETKKNGNFYLETGSDEPYAIKQKGGFISSLF